MFNAVLATRPTRGGVRLSMAALLMLRAAAIHFAVTPEHLEEYAPFDVFLLAVGSIQALIAIELLVRPSRRVALGAAGVAAAAANAMPASVDVAPALPDQHSISVTSLTEPAGPEHVDSFTLTAEVIQVDGHAAQAFNGSIPGPELRVTQGDRVRVTLVNHLPAATTIHVHGIRLPNAEDRDYTLLFHNASDGHGVAIDGVAGALHLTAEPGELVRLRLINAVVPDMDGGPQTPVLFGAPYPVVALDGHDLNEPQVLGPERLPLGMGQRADLVFSMPSSGAVQLVDSLLTGRPSALERVFPPASSAATVTIGDGQPPAATDPQGLPLFDPTTYGAPAVDPVATGPFETTHPVVLDKHPGFRDGRPELLHTVNGQTAPYVPPIDIHAGEVVRLHIVHQSGEYHPMHLHGHSMSVLARNGQPIQGSPLHLDTLLVGPDETWDVAIAADNPGIWRYHCHVLLHAGSGMRMTINYAGVSTPFETGTSSGNQPA